MEKKKNIDNDNCHYFKLLKGMRTWYPEKVDDEFIEVEEIGTRDEEALALRIDVRSDEERHAGGNVIDERVAVLGTNNRIKIIYPNACQQNMEADYLMRLFGMRGVPILYEEASALRNDRSTQGVMRDEEGENYNIVERVYPLPDGKYPRNVICVFAYKLISLIRTLYDNDIIHGHFRYFTMQSGGDIYLVDSVHYTCVNRGDIHNELQSALELIAVHCNYPKLMEKLRAVLNSDTNDLFADLLNSIVSLYQHASHRKLPWTN